LELTAKIDPEIEEDGRLMGMLSLVMKMSGSNLKNYIAKDMMKTHN
jgi:hypothetical protein